MHKIFAGVGAVDGTCSDAVSKLSVLNVRLTADMPVAGFPFCGVGW
ncbi:MAG: hypothetical protein ACKERG_03720 [Candidatus Hodgkinia cicadicola]